MAKNNKGKPFEDAVRKSFEQVPGVSIDRLKDASLVRTRNKTKKLKGVNNPSDFIVYKRPHEIYVECKSHKGNTLPFSCIREEQITGMLEKSLILGVTAGVMLWYIDHDLTVWIPIDVVVTLMNFGFKSINIKDLDKIPHLVVPGKKKRVYFEYNMKQFLEDLYGERKTNIKGTNDRA